MEKVNSDSVLLASEILLLSCFYLQSGTALDTITPSKSIKDPEFIISQSGAFRLGFFSFANSTNRYVGILYHQIPVQTVVWVANRNKPLKDSSGILNISDDGNLVVSNGKAEVLWSSHVNNTAPNATTAQLLDSGNLVLSNGEDGASSLWESFEDPSNAFIETMKIRTDVKKGRKVELKSWKSIDDPSDGSFSFGFEPFNIPELVIRNNNKLYFRSGPWNGNTFIGVIMKTVYIDGFHVVADNQQQTYYFTYEYSDNYRLKYYELDSQGNLFERTWDAGKGDWINRYSTSLTESCVYGQCGAFGICDRTKQPICSCLKGFKPRNIEAWSRGNWSSGCFRTTLLQCERDKNNGSEAGQGDDDGFLKLKTMKVPAFPDRSSINNGECKDQCMKNCSCVAYAYDAGIGCMFWSGDLIDMQKFSTQRVDLYIRLPSSELDKGKSNKVIVIAAVIVGTVTITIMILFLWCWMAKRRGRKQKHKQIKLQLNKGNAMTKFSTENVGEYSIGVKLQQLRLFNFEELAIATDNFDHAKKLGQGGFGPVYRGILRDEKEIAVKRLSKASGQGLEEFMNEVEVISKIQHRNLVKLLGCCVEAEEKMLVYEYMPNKSLDTFVFDFGMARIFGGDENQANTKRVVGTYGYMSPEYAIQGQFSEKSDVFSFGVLLLEIVSGRKNTSLFNNQDYFSLLGYVWKLWNEGNIWSLVDKVVLEPKSNLKNVKEIRRCIHIGLLCVQEYATDRPTMSTVVSMLNSEISNFNTPKQPAFTQTPLITHDVQNRASVNGVTLTDFDGR
ncbi:G-type lectin S-receptor-like serine/threonine-protein kinase At1g11330 isoform X2 [Gossypium arboreum]|uniref:G-type lectin S-receptor-like serine/threonine-protein kinase At1g11330 isoform X2 n=1 Tax=Gossypium arboreum TaxID=29729 RepID=UPI0022F1623A|nr:G-type lectin S-receptor-like serine/threonine-protein kinase At1g11330 isoform X2 [Gossypium arboreum]